MPPDGEHMVDHYQHQCVGCATNETCEDCGQHNTLGVVHVSGTANKKSDKFHRSNNSSGGLPSGSEIDSGIRECAVIRSLPLRHPSLSDSTLRVGSRMG